MALTFRDDRLDLVPPNRVAYLPVVRRLRQAPTDTFARAELLEFRQRDHGAAIAALRPMTSSSDPAVRAEALLRLGRNLRRAGRFDEALTTYARLTVVFHRNGAAYVDSDEDALSRAVRNLLDNAVKYSPDHRAVEVGLSSGDGSVRIVVRDHGMGIPVHERGTIFGKFQRGEQARLHGIKGTGIGLAMVDEIVRAHHGRVEVESEPGHGSTFTIVLPATE